jgi:hypothetical protein
MARVLRLTLDTSCVIHAVQTQRYRDQVDQLVELARSGRIGLWLTSAFVRDQSRASADRREANLAWLSQRPVIERAPGPFRLAYSPLGEDDVLATDAQADADRRIQQIVLPEGYRPGQLRDGDAAFMDRWRRKVTDVHHLTAHLMSRNDAFVTSDEDDLLKKRAALEAEVGIVVVNPEEAVEMTRQSQGGDGSSP